jgi:hypothetical protein
MSFFDTPDFKDSIGFLVRASLIWRINFNQIIIPKGSLFYGFRSLQNNDVTYGYIVDNDEELYVTEPNGTHYITLDKNGIFRCNYGDYSDVHGLGADIDGIPWYTFNGNALIGKIFKESGLVTGFIICDDPYWCEFEGDFE